MSLNLKLITRFFFVIVSASLGACSQSIIPSFRQPNRLYDIAEEEQKIKLALESSHFTIHQTKEDRNNYIYLRMYAIDLEYTKYESQLTHENQSISFASTAVDLGLTGAASVIPAGQTTRVLSAIATGVTGANAAYDKDILLAQAIQNIQTAMRADRNEKAARIFANMNCSTALYPMGAALTDLEDFYRAGTLTAGLIGVTTSVNRAASDAKTQKDSVSPSPAVHEPAQQTLVNNAVMKASQADSAQGQTDGSNKLCPLKT